MRVAVRGLRQGRVGQAQLLVAPADGGAVAVAETIAMAQVCARPAADGVPCGDCAGCVAVRQRTHPDLHWSASAGSLGIDEVRAIVAATQRRPVLAAVSVFVLEACERLTGPAAAALLKTLEDPPGPVLFLFLTGVPEGLEATLRSRCLPLRLRPMDRATLAAWLRQERPDLSEQAAAALSRDAGGWAPRALALAAHWGEPAVAPTTAEPLVRGLLAESLEAAASAAVALAGAGAGPHAALSAVRDALLGSCGLSEDIPPASDLPRSHIDALVRACPPRVWAEALPVCLRAVEAAEANVNPTLNWQVLFIRLQQIRRTCYAF